MIFVDESGDPGYPDDGKWTGWGGSTHFARVGVIIHGWKWKAWNRRLLNFKSANGLQWYDEIKASDIRRGEKCFYGWSQSKRNQFLLDLLKLVGSTVDISLIGIDIDKTRVITSKTARLVKPEVRSLELLLERYNFFLRQQTDQSGIVVLDPIKEASDDNIRHFQSFLQSRAPHFQPLHIVESTFFAKSHTSSMIQLADVFTNVFYRAMTRGMNNPEYVALSNRFLHNARGVVMGYGIKRWPP